MCVQPEILIMEAAKLTTTMYNVNAMYDKHSITTELENVKKPNTNAKGTPATYM